MEFEELPIVGAYRLTARCIGDERGEFARFFCQDEFAPYLSGGSVCQINYSVNRRKGTVRGLHYQRSPHAEVKIVRCLTGKVFDVFVDLRADSETFLRTVAVELSADNKAALLIPQGCAHGFQALENDSAVLYLHSDFYTPAAEGGVRYDDPRLAIPWPLPPINVSARDRQHPLITPEFAGLHPTQIVER